MKKITYIFYLCALSVFLSCCTNGFSYSVDKIEIASIEIIEYDNYQQNVTYHTLYVLNSDEISNFIDDFSKIDFSRVYGDPYGFSGKCILIKYLNDDYEIICQKYIERRNIDNEVLTWHYYHADESKFQELLDRYTES